MVGDQSFKLGIVGCQGIGAHMARIASECHGIALVACCDISEQNANALAGQFHIPYIYYQYDELLENGIIDAVYIATPHFLHDSMIRKAVLRGIPVLCEKPITEKAETARILVDWVLQQGVKVGINYQRRYDTNLYGLICAVQQGLLGNIRYARINVPWERDWDYFGSSTWHTSITKAGGGTFITQASHYLDIVLQAIAPDVVSDVFGVTDRLKFSEQIEVEDFGMGILRTQGGRYIELCSSMAAHPQQPVRIEIYGEKGTVIFDDSKTELAWMGIVPEPATCKVTEMIDGMEQSLIAFRDWICKDVPFRIPIKSALPVLECIDGIYRSSAEGRVIRICLNED